MQDLFKDLPDPKKDELPPYVRISEEGAERAAEEKALMGSLMSPKNDTEKRVKYVLGILGGHFKKDGDWQSRGGGRTFFSKKTADLVGSIPAGGYNWHTYVEVKGMSPGKIFSFSRLDKRSNPDQPSQFEKLSEAWDRGDFVMLALGWWFPIFQPIEPVMVKQKSRTIERWRLSDLAIDIDLIRWDMFVDVYRSINRRSLRPRDMDLFPPCRIYKESNRWRLCDDHWWNRLEVHESKLGRLLAHH